MLFYADPLGGVISGCTHTKSAAAASLIFSFFKFKNDIKWYKYAAYDEIYHHFKKGECAAGAALLVWVNTKKTPPEKGGRVRIKISCWFQREGGKLLKNNRDFEIFNENWYKLVEVRSRPYGRIFEFYKKFWTELAQMCPNAVKNKRRNEKIDKTFLVENAIFRKNRVWRGSVLVCIAEFLNFFFTRT